MKEVKLLYPPVGPIAFKRMLDKTSQAKKGEIVKVLDKNGEFFGYAFLNTFSNVALRILSREYTENFDIEEFIRQKVLEAINSRKLFGLPSSTTNAYRLVNDYGDGLPGLVIDVYDKNLVVEFYSIGWFNLKDKLKKILNEIFPGYSVFYTASSYTQKMEGFTLEKENGKKIKILENGVIFEVNLSSGYKTGFFCDQRENRFLFSRFASGKKVLDLCAYTGGFGIYAKKLGGAEEVTCVELDKDSVENLKRNANLNSVRINSVCADVFTYMRQMIELKREYDLVVLDPHKVISSREEKQEGIIKYKDMNKLAISLVKRGGVFVSCSCSGLLSWNEFLEILRYSASVSKRKLQIFNKTGAGPDHPYMVSYLEGEYLKVVWSRVF